MKKQFLKLTFLLVTIFYNNDNILRAQISLDDGYEIYATIDGVKDGTEYYLRRNNSRGSTDTISKGRIKNGKLYIKGNVEEMELYFLFLEGNKRYLPLLMENAKFSIVGSYNSWPHLHVKGTSQNDEYQSIWKTVDKDLVELKMLGDSILKYSRNTKDTLFTNQFASSRNLIMARFYDTTIPFLIKKHPNSVYTPLMIRIHSKASTSEKMKMYNDLPIHVRKSKYGRELLKDINIKEKVLVAEEKNTIPDFELPMPIMGEKMSLLRFAGKNKLVYIDFWASWCAPCRAQFPELKKIYTKYKDYGFSILGVSIDSNELSWRKAVAEEKLPWYNVCDFEGKNSDISRMYKLDYIPRSVLIDKSGKVIARDIHGEELSRTIEGYLK